MDCIEESCKCFDVNSIRSININYYNFFHLCIFLNQYLISKQVSTSSRVPYRLRVSGVQVVSSVSWGKGFRVAQGYLVVLECPACKGYKACKESPSWPTRGHAKKGIACPPCTTDTPGIAGIAGPPGTPCATRNPFHPQGECSCVRTACTAS